MLTVSRETGSPTLAIGSLFSGYGGLELGIARALEAEVAWHAEIEPAANRVLARRFEGVPNFGDVSAIDWTGFAPVDVLCGGFPCQDVSVAGLRRGLAPDSRSGLWSEFVRAIAALRPSLVVIENVRGLTSAPAHRPMEPDPDALGNGPTRPPLRALGAVLGDLADLGFDAEWIGVRAADVGAPHGRFRIFLVATPADAEGVRLRPWLERGGSQTTLAVPRRDRHADRAGRDTGGSGTAADPQDADLEPRDERRLAASGQTEGGWPRADARGRDRAHAPDPAGSGRDRVSDRAEYDRDEALWREAVDPARDRDRPASADAADSERRERERRRGPSAVARTPGPARDEDRRPADPGRNAARDRGSDPLDWGPYARAIDRWERRLGRVAPAPTDGRRLAPRFVEWMMGLPEGWVTDPQLGISRSEQLRLLGNGVVPQQAERAIRLLLARGR